MKMFYTIEEAAKRLGKSVSDVEAMAESGQLQQFQDRGKQMFKREQVDLLAGGGGDDDAIPLAESGELEPLTLASSGTGTAMGINAGDDKESTGLNIFEVEGTDDADANAVTRITSSPGSLMDPGNEKSGSGGLLDLTKEGDDTSLGSNLLDDVYGGDTMAAQTAADVPAEGGALFESPDGGAGDAGFGGETAAAAGGVMMVPEVYDGAGSGWVGGAALGMLVACLLAVFVVVLSITSPAGNPLINTIGGLFLPVIGGVAVLAALFAGIGFFLGKKS